MTEISIAKGATIYQETKRSFYDKVQRGSTFYPKLHNKKLDLDECLKLSKQLQEFKLNNIDIHEASKIMFNDDAKLAGLYRILHDKNELNKFFLPVTKYGKRLYFKRDEFIKFWKENCKSSRLFKIGELQNRLGFLSSSKFYLFLKECDFSEKVQPVKLVKTGINFYPLAHINDWLYSIGEKSIRS